MTITITLNTDNAAFEDGKEQEIERILRAWLDEGIDLSRKNYLRDYNGNTVGAVTITGR